MSLVKKVKGLQKKLSTVISSPADLDALFSGVYHYKNKDETIEKLKNERALKCFGCEYRELDDYEPIKDEDERINGMMCGSCFCPLPYLLRQTKKGCKEGKWK